ncbi:MAG TPA: PIG-L family deacetylase [Ilumatobacteraceae bacterium]|nr:PIG-L family deacetylase [Ilumatobacteraceae bacterium]
MNGAAKLHTSFLGSLDVDRLGTVLSVWAHPDDETYLAGGLMAACAAAGQRVVCVSATAGEHGTPDPVAWPPERLGRVRRWESAAAMAVLGVDDHRVLGFEDGTLATIEPSVGISAIRQLIDEVRPDTILTFGPDGMTFHSDHIAIGAWTTRAWESTGRSARLLYAATTHAHQAAFGAIYEEWGIYMTDERPLGYAAVELAVHHVLHDERLDQKLAALAAMASQTADVIATLDPAVWRAANSEECFVDASTVSARTTASTSPATKFGFEAVGDGG